jgi:hypothetical protein
MQHLVGDWSSGPTAAGCDDEGSAARNSGMAREWVVASRANSVRSSLVNQPTFDMSVLRAALHPDEAGHEDAVRLLTLAAAGVLEIGVPPQGARADFRGDMTTPKAQRMLALVASPGVVDLRQLAVPSNVTYPGPNFFPETPVEGFAQAWAAIAADWRNGPGHKPGDQDRWYVESRGSWP